MPAEHPRHLAEHARQRHDRTLQRAQQALTELTAAGQQVTVALLADRAGVSRSWIYTQPALRDRLRQLQQRRASAGFVRDTVTRATDDSLRQRLPPGWPNHPATHREPATPRRARARPRSTPE